MKLLRTLAVVTAITIIVLFNWMCKDDNIVMPPENEQQKDDPTVCEDSQLIWFNVVEYAYVEPQGGSPYYENRLITVQHCESSCFPVMQYFNNFSITTPPSPRTEGLNTITTVKYMYYYGINYCAYTTTGRVAAWGDQLYFDDIQGLTYDDGSYSNSVDPVVGLSPNTTWDYFAYGIFAEDK